MSSGPSNQSSAIESNPRQQYGNETAMIITQSFSTSNVNKAFVREVSHYEFIIPITEIPGSIVNQQIFDSSPDYIYFNPPKTHYGLSKTVSSIAYSKIYFDNDFFESVAKTIPYCSRLSKPLTLPLTDSILTLIRMYKIESRREQNQSIAVLDRLAFLLCSELIRLCIQNQASAEKNLFFTIDDISSYMIAHSNKDLTIDEISERAGMSKFHFIRVFTKIKGQTPYAYLLEARLAKARNLLEFSNLTISEIAERCGFTSLNYFSKAFKNNFGIPATLYRKNRN